MKSRESIDFHPIVDVDRDGNQDDPSGENNALVDSPECEREPEGDQEFECEQEMASGRPASISTAGSLTVSSLSVADFQRIGLHPRETRLAVIRRAASRTSRALATLQLSSPSLATEQQLSRVALSTYRLLDPRQRSDRQSRAHVGRIRPGVLQSVGRASFSEYRERGGKPSANSVSAGNGNEGSGNEGSVAADLSPSVAAAPRNRVLGNTIDLPPVTDQAFEAPFVPIASHQSMWERLLHHAQRPGAVMLLIVVLVLAAIGVWYWGHTMAQIPKDRFYQSER